MNKIIHTVGLIIVPLQDPHVTLCVPLYEFVVQNVLGITYLFYESS